ncbi:MAG: Bug family tripartite tricarboxylate transporter substrate binding protein [Xanthobacteraceae bacterium]
MRAFRRYLTAGAGFLLMILAIGVSAAAADSFYKGKTVTLLVGGSAGGGYDTLGRAIARYIGGHIPGNPSIVVEDMPGAGGLVAVDYLFRTAPRDGSMIALVENGPPLAPLFGVKQAHYDATKFNWLGTPSVETAVTLLWHTVPVNSLADLKLRPTTMGASGTNSTQAFYTRLIDAVLGTKMKAINGYKGLSDTFLAMERGEIDGSPSVFYSAITSTRPHWLPDHLAKAILQYGPRPVKALAGVPFVSDLVTAPDDKLLLQAAFAPLALGRPLVMPPGVAADRVAVMRQALADTFADPAFVADAKKIGLVVNAPQSGQQLQTVIDKAYASPPRIIGRLRALNAGADR